MNHKTYSEIIRLQGRIIFLCLVLSAFPGRAQRYFFDQYSVSEGLAQSTVYAVIQDSNDYFWLGTQAGVSHFDGVEFTNFTAEDGLAENGVRAIFEDSHGRIWFGHDGGGISRYDGEHFEVYEDAKMFMKSDITSFAEDRDGRLWVTSAASGAVMLSNIDGPFPGIKYEVFGGSRLSDRVFAAVLAKNGDVLFVADPMVKKMNLSTDSIENLLLNGMPRYFITTSILEDSRGNTWFGTYNGGLYKYDINRDTTEMIDLIRAGLTSNWVSTIYEDGHGNVWAGTWGGGVVRIRDDGRMQIFNETNGLPGLKIWRFLEDKEGNILIGTHEHGLCVFKGDYFVSYTVQDGLKNAQTWAIMQARDGKLWLGTNEGIAILDNTKSDRPFIIYDYLQSDRVRFLEQDRSGTVWIGTENQGVFAGTPDGRNVFEPYLNRNIYGLQVTAMELDQENNLWVGTLDGLVYYEIEQQKGSRLTQVDGLYGNQVSAIYADSRGAIWVGTDGKGVTVIRGNKFSIVPLEVNITPTAFIEDKNGKMWIGTEGRGVLVIDPESGELINTLTVKDGLMANLINLLNCDAENNIYIGTNKGLNKYIQSEEKMFQYTRKNGFTGIETKPNSTWLDKDGHLWFGTVNGISCYYPERENRIAIQPLTHISGFMVNYKPYSMVPPVNLSHRENNLIFDYRSITLNPEAVEYMTFLEGIDEEWRPSGSQTQINFPALPASRYNFLVKAKNGEGIWNDPPISFSFQIRPPFYKTWWFILICVVAGTLIILAYIKAREQALVRENKVLEDKVKKRTAEVVAQKEELAQKNKDITDSIRYAKRIQFAILPPEMPFRDTFILFKPKDIVSGDFYWLTKVENKEFFAAVDCTGHGVPGAFMSIIGHNSLTKIVREYGITEPGKILTRLNSELANTLHQHSEAGEVYDGMDLALVAYDPETNVLEYAGAFNPLYLVREGELREVRADRIAIGRQTLESTTEFTTHRIDIKKGDSVYLFSDGYADQFGGEMMKKFKYTNLKALFTRIWKEPMEKQKKILNDTLIQWQGQLEQVDDILIIGRRF